MKHLITYIRYVTCRIILGFSDLTQDDQLILIKSGFFEIWLAHTSRMISSLDNTLTFSDGSYITKQQMENMLNVSTKPRIILVIS